MQFRIGDRDPITGLYDVVWPDGSTTRNGLKMFNAAHQTGDVVLATERSDGMMILDSAKAITTDSTRSIANPDLVNPPPDYLQGQVFNREEEELPKLSIDFAPNSPTALARGQGNFVIRVSLNRAIASNLVFAVALTGTAVYQVDYSASVNLAQQITIPAGSLYKDITITPIGQKINSVDSAFAITLQPGAGYQIAKPDVNLAIEHNVFGYKIHFGLASQTQAGGTTPTAWTFTEFTGDLTTANLADYESAWTTERTNPTKNLYAAEYALPGGITSTLNSRVNLPDYPMRNLYAVAANYNTDYGLFDLGNGNYRQDALYREDYDVFT